MHKIKNTVKEVKSRMDSVKSKIDGFLRQEKILDGREKKQETEPSQVRMKMEQSPAAAEQYPAGKTKELQRYKEKAQAVCRQDQVFLRKFGLPTAEEILILEGKAERLQEVYNTTRTILQLYLDAMGIRRVLQTMTETAVRIPQGLWEYDEEKQSLPLHVYVWNTSADTLRRQYANLYRKYARLEQLLEQFLEQTEETADIEEKKAELLKNIRTAMAEYLAEEGSQNNTWRLQRALQAYSARKTAAEESLQTYTAAVSEEKNQDVLTFCRELTALMNSEAFRNLETYEVHEGEKTLTDIDGTEVYLDPTTIAYWEKVTRFASEAENLLKKWDDSLKN